jgi:hypothetical protein
MDPSVLPFFYHLLPFYKTFSLVPPFSLHSLFFLVGHRSPPSHIRENKPTPTAQTSRAGDSSLPLQATTTRARTRFDQPASTSPKTSRTQQAAHDDIYIPDDLLSVRRDEEPRLTFTQVGGVENDTKRRRTNDRATGASSSNRRAAAQVESALAPAPPSLNERSASASSLSPGAGEQQRTYYPIFDYYVLHTNYAFLRVFVCFHAYAGSKRIPLPPQSARFREMSKRAPNKSDPPPPAPQVVQAASNDGGMMQSSTNAEHSLPSGPRHQPQQNVSSRDTNQVESRKSSRLPPLGPSGNIIIRHRRVEPVFSPHLSIARGRNAMEVDSAPPPRPPVLRINDTTIRANSGMYADREQQRVEMANSTDAAPRGPRAMTNRVPSGSSHISMTSSSSTSPTTPLHGQRSAVPHEFHGSRLRVRSPPPHLVDSNVSQTRDAPLAKFIQVNGAALRSNDRGLIARVPYQMPDQVRGARVPIHNPVFMSR